MCAVLCECYHLFTIFFFFFFPLAREDGAFILWWLLLFARGGGLIDVCNRGFFSLLSFSFLFSFFDRCAGLENIFCSCVLHRIGAYFFVISFFKCNWRSWTSRVITSVRSLGRSRFVCESKVLKYFFFSFFSPFPYVCHRDCGQVLFIRDIFFVLVFFWIFQISWLILLFRFPLIHELSAFFLVSFYFFPAMWIAMYSLFTSRVCDGTFFHRSLLSIRHFIYLC